MRSPLSATAGTLGDLSRDMVPRQRRPCNPVALRGVGAATYAPGWGPVPPWTRDIAFDRRIVDKGFNLNGLGAASTGRICSIGRDYETCAWVGVEP